MSTSDPGIIMTVILNLETRQRALSEWWTEETGYIFQRIERWATCARGYNRLRSQRISRGRMTMEENLSSRWNIPGKKLFIDDVSWNPRFHTLNRSYANKSQPEELKLNCCGTLNYRSNAKLDSNCLETYSYDHSIYFKTIGDLKRNKNQEERNQSLEKKDLKDQDWEKKTDWEQPKKKKEQFNQLIFIESFSEDDTELYSRTSAWPEVDLSKLSIDQIDENANMNQKRNKNENYNLKQNKNKKLEFNGNLVENENNHSNLKDPVYNFQIFSELKSLDSEVFDNQKEMKRFSGTKKKLKRCQPVVGDDNIVWPGVLLTYNKNIDPVSSPHRYVESMRESDCYFVAGL